VKISREQALRVYWIVSLCALAFAYGLAVGVFRIFPYELFRQLGSTGRELIQFPRHTLRLTPEKFFAASPPEGTGVDRHVADKPSPGMTLITGFFDGSTAIRLIDIDGRELNQWRISYNEIWPTSPHLDKQPHDWNTEVHGAMLQPDGDVIFTFQYAGLVRLDRCGDVVWKLPRQTNHQFVADAEGNLWVPSRELREQPIPKYPKVPAPFYEEYVLKVSPEGKVLAEISMLDAIFESRFEGLLFANGAHDPGLERVFNSDFTHLNDVEVLTPDLAPAFPMFETGDLLVSLRNLDLLMVIDPETRQIKWTQTGPFIRQHDPDFLATGQIAVFDNRRSGGNKLFGGSRILAIDPGTRLNTTLYGAAPGQGFYTDTMGGQQSLPNGDLLITESDKGHAFEVDPGGNVVWSYVNRWADGSVGKISEALRYPEDYLSHASKEPCHGS
jgi:arylsulfotransferase ASST